MQPLARDGLTAEQVRALLTADAIEVSAGLELLDGSNVLVADISDDLSGGSVDRDNYATVHGSCSLQITRPLAWGKDRVRPYMTMSDGAVTARFNCGVYVLTTPNSQRGEEPPTWSVTGYDLLHLLQDGPGDTYVATAGTTYLQAVQDVVTASGVGAILRLDGEKQNTTLPADRVWALPVQVSWLDIINDLLREIGYLDIFANHDGELRSRPFASIDQAAVDWTLDTSDEATNIVGEDRTVAEDVWGAPNHWRFIRQRMAYQPVEGDGIYTVTNDNDGPTSIASLGRTVRRTHYLDAPDQASLMAQGDQIVAEDRQVTRTITLSIDPLPVQGHRDVFVLKDDGVTEKVFATSWSLPLDGSPGRLVLGGDKTLPPQPIDQQATATVTQASPLRVVVDGATTDSIATVATTPAEVDVGGTLTPVQQKPLNIGDRVTATVRNPQPPLVQGEES